MHCPDCRKKVHADDVYCVWCGAPLRKGILPTGINPHEEATPEIAPEKGKHLGLRVLISALGFVLVLATIYLVSARQSSFQRSQEPPVMTVPENAQVLDVLLVQWEGFTLRGDYLTQDEASGELEIAFTAENHSNYTILCGDPLASLEEYQLRGEMFLELPSGESATGYLRIDTEPLQSRGFHRIQEMTLSLSIFNARDASLLTRTESVPILLDRELPQRTIRPTDTILLEEPGLSVRLTGVASDAENGEIYLYTLLENQSGEETSFYLKDICWEGAGPMSSNYYSLPAGTRLLTCSWLYGVPSGTAGQISLKIVSGSGSVQSCTIFLAADGTVAEVINIME